MKANVQKVSDIQNTIDEIKRFTADLQEAVDLSMKVAADVKKEAIEEELDSRSRLEAAKQEESSAKIKLDAAKAAVRVAEVALTAATLGGPTAISVPKLSMILTGAKAAEGIAQENYEKAKAHRAAMEGRYQIVQEALQRAMNLYSNLESSTAAYSQRIKRSAQEGVSRLTNAEKDLSKYESLNSGTVGIRIPLARKSEEVSGNKVLGTPSSRNSQKVDVGVLSPVISSGSSKTAATHNAKPENQSAENKDDGKNKAELHQDDNTTNFDDELAKYLLWKKYTVQSDVVKPKEIIDRMNPDNNVQIGLLENLYRMDDLFHNQIDRLRAKLSDANDNVKKLVQLQSKKNIAGRLGEEIIKDGLSPFTESVQTQTRQNLKDGSYTKIDIVLKDLKAPMIFGRGEGMAAMKGGNVAIEVKSGQSNYLVSQEKHVLKQVEGHAKYDVSIVVYSRDLKGIPGEDAYRNDIKEAGSRALGMLPPKVELDKSVWQFLTVRED